MHIRTALLCGVGLLPGGIAIAIGVVVGGLGCRHSNRGDRYRSGNHTRGNSAGCGSASCTCPRTRPARTAGATSAGRTRLATRRRLSQCTSCEK